MLNKENNPPEILVSLAQLGWAASFTHWDTQKGEIFSMILFVCLYVYMFICFLQIAG